MKINEVKIGNWVEFDYRKNWREAPTKKLGFIINKGLGKAKVAVPKERKTYYVDFTSLKDRNESEEQKHDVDRLIDLALDLKDFAWVEELRAIKYAK